MSHRIAILLCAGYGTRMGALTRDTPKPLLPVADRPVLDYLLDQLMGLPSLRDIHVVSNQHYFAAFEAWGADRRTFVERHDRRLFVHNDGTLSNEDRLGAIGDLGFVLDRIRAAGSPPDGALACAGDNILRFSLLPLWRRFLDHGRTTVLAMEEKDPARLRRTGVLEINDSGRVIKLWEKPENPPSSWACPSFYALSRSALAQVQPYLDQGHAPDEIGRFIGFLAEQTGPDHGVWALETDGERLHVGNPESLRHADEVLRREQAVTA